MLYSLTIAVGFLRLSAMVQASVQPRADIQATAQCQPQYEWMNNHQGLTPCYLYGAVSAPCLQGRYNVGPLKSGNHYEPPLNANATVTECACSWAAYNLQSACALCQGFSEGVNTWNFYKPDCGSKLMNDTYWPPGISILGNNKIPAYAATDPTTWRDQKFDEGQARESANKNPPDLDGKPIVQAEAEKHKTPVAPIAGGVVGGVVLLAGLGILLWICVRRRRASAGAQEIPSPKNSFMHNGRTVLDNSQKGAESMTSYPGYYPPSSSPSPPPMSSSQSVYTYNGSMQAFSQFGAASAYTTLPNGTSSHGHGVMSPTPTMHTTLPGPADHIQPYTLMESDTAASAFSLAQRRKADLALGHEGVSSGQLDGVAEESLGVVLPPAYSAYPTPNETSSSHEVANARREREGHGHRPSGSPPEKGSQDTQSSYPWTSTTSEGVSYSMIATPERGQSRNETPTSRPDPPNRHYSVRSVGSEDAVDVA